jgi:arginine/lysine/ornithine decarboxylase
LHTPAHRGHVDPAYGAALGDALALDLTELDETDDLRDPAGAIAEAQALAAAHFGAARTWFLVGGASAGNHASLLATAAGRKVAIARNAHVSAVGGLVLSDADPVWIPVPWDGDWDVARGPEPAAVAATLAENPDTAAVFVTAPTYFGDAADLAAIRKVCGGRPLIVDEAHGAHIPRALAAGADLVVHSAHKGLTGPTQGGYLQLGRGSRLDPEAVSASLRLVQSTSPSYWLLAGLDAARRESAVGKPTTPLLHLPGEVRPGDDPTRVLVRAADGFAAYDLLAAAGIVCEAALPRAVFLLLGPAKLTGAEVGKLAGALDSIDRVPATGAQRAVGPPALPEAVMRPREAALGPAERVAIRQASGRICAEALCPYPPGIPVVVPGERIGSDAIDFLAIHAPELRSVRVVSRP